MGGCKMKRAVICLSLLWGFWGSGPASVFSETVLETQSPDYIHDTQVYRYQGSQNFKDDHLSISANWNENYASRVYFTFDIRKFLVDQGYTPSRVILTGIQIQLTHRKDAPGWFAPVEVHFPDTAWNEDIISWILQPSFSNTRFTYIPNKKQGEADILASPLLVDRFQSFINDTADLWKRGILLTAPNAPNEGKEEYEISYAASENANPVLRPRVTITFALVPLPTATPTKKPVILPTPTRTPLPDPSLIALETRDAAYIRDTYAYRHQPADNLQNEDLGVAANGKADFTARAYLALDIKQLLIDYGYPLEEIDLYGVVLELTLSRPPAGWFTPVEIHFPNQTWEEGRLTWQNQPTFSEAKHTYEPGKSEGAMDRIASPELDGLFRSYLNDPGDLWKKGIVLTAPKAPLEGYVNQDISYAGSENALEYRRPKFTVLFKWFPGGVTPTFTPTNTPSSTPTPVFTPTPTFTLEPTASPTLEPSFTPTPSFTPVPEATSTPTATLTPTASFTNTPTPTNTPTRTPTPTPGTHDPLNGDSLLDNQLTLDPPAGYRLGSVRFGEIPAGQGTDGRGMEIDLSPGEGVWILSNKPIAAASLAQISGSFRISNKSAAVALVALNSPIDGQLGYTNITGDENPIADYRPLNLFYRPPAGTLQIAIQAVNPPLASLAARIWVDELDVKILYSLEEERPVPLQVDGGFERGVEKLITNINNTDGQIMPILEANDNVAIRLSIQPRNLAANIGTLITGVENSFPLCLVGRVSAWRDSLPGGGTLAFVMTNGFQNMGLVRFVDQLPGSGDLPEVCLIGGDFTVNNPNIPIHVVLQNGGPGADSSLAVDNLRILKQ